MNSQTQAYTQKKIKLFNQFCKSEILREATQSTGFFLYSAMTGISKFYEFYEKNILVLILGYTFMHDFYVCENGNHGSPELSFFAVIISLHQLSSSRFYPLITQTCYIILCAPSLLLLPSISC